MHDIDLVERAVIGLHDAEALQEDQGVVAELAVLHPGKMDRAERAGHGCQMRGGKASRQRLAVELHLNRKTQAQALDTIAQAGQVNAVKIYPGPGDGFGDRFDVDGSLGQRRCGVDVDPLMTRGDDTARCGIQALREADPERAFLGTGRCIPA